MRQNEGLIQVVRQHILTQILILLYPWHVKSLLYLSWKKKCSSAQRKGTTHFSLICYGPFSDSVTYRAKNLNGILYYYYYTKISHKTFNVRKLALPLPKKAPDLQLDTQTRIGLYQVK